MDMDMEMEMEFSDGEETKPVAHIPATFVPPFSRPAYDGSAVMATHGNLAGALEKGKERDVHEQLPGYIFMCNGKTKPECYRYRVFGLPKGRKDIVKNIKPGMKLFLYDFEKRLLYGIYEATIGGRLNIEPDAFGRKYPAQVGFRIVKNCYPLPERAFKPAIQENYQGAKFKQELNPHQVMNLLSVFRSFLAPKLDLVPLSPASLASSSEVNLLGSENQFFPRTRELSFEERYIAAKQLKLALSGLDSLSIHHADPWLNSHMPPVQHSYSRQGNHMNPKDPLSMSNLNMLRNPSQSSIQDPELKYLTILSNIRRYGTDPESVTLQSEYNPAMSSGHEHYASLSSSNRYYPSTLSGNELSSISSVSGNGYYPSTSSGQQPDISYADVYHHQAGNGLPSISSTSGNGYYPSTSSVQQPDISYTNFYHHQASTAANATVSMQSDMQVIGYVSQSLTRVIGYPQLTHGQEVESAPQAAVEAIDLAPQPHLGTIGYTRQSHPGAAEDNTQSYAGAVVYAQQHVGAIGYDPQLYAGAVGYTPQPQAEAIGYAPQPRAEAIGYAPQMHAEAVGFAPQPVEAQTAPVGASGTTHRDVTKGSYSGATNWDAVNQCYYYSYAAGTTTSYNQTC